MATFDLPLIPFEAISFVSASSKHSRAYNEPVFVNLLIQDPGNRFPAWRAGTTTLFDVPAHQ